MKERKIIYFLYPFKFSNIFYHISLIQLSELNTEKDDDQSLTSTDSHNLKKDGPIFTKKFSKCNEELKGLETECKLKQLSYKRFFFIFYLFS